MASLKLAEAQASASSSAAATVQTLSDYLLDAWSESRMILNLIDSTLPESIH